MQKRTSLGFTTAELLVTMGIFLAVFLVFSDAVSNAKYRVRSKVCTANFRKIGQAILTFRSAHGGKMPPNLAALPDKYALSCPLTGSKYSYRYLATSHPDDIICWDSRPQIPYHTVFTYLNKANRNVLTTDGKVRNLTEEQFQASHLQAQQ